MADNPELIIRFHAVSGEDLSVLSRDFHDESEALETIARAMDERHSLMLTHGRYNREAAESGVIVNLTNVVSVRLGRTDTATTGQYL
jgi:hypothetical protein